MKYRTDALRYALRITRGHREDAEDLVHDAWVRMTEAYGDRARNPQPLLYRIMVNLYNDAVARKIRERRYAQKELPAEHETPCLDSERALQALEALPEPFGEVCRCYFREGYGQRELAERFHVKHGTIKSRINRAVGMI